MWSLWETTRSTSSGATVTAQGFIPSITCASSVLAPSVSPKVLQNLTSGRGENRVLSKYEKRLWIGILISSGP